MKKNSNIDPLIRISRRDNVTIKDKILIRSGCIIFSVFISLLFILIASGKNPFSAIEIMVLGAFKGKIAFSSLIKETILLLAIALALLPAYKMKFWNVGAQGQILIGALVTSFIMIKFTNLNNVLMIILSIACSIIAGGIWALIPAIFKAKYNTNETLFTLMMNYIAIQIVSFATENWRGDKSAVGMINGFTEKGWLPELFNNANYIPMILVIALMIFMYVYINKSKHGYEIKLVGESDRTARYAGVNVKKVIVRTLFLSGALCGAVGFIYVAGFDHTISSTTSGSYGFTAIIVCWLSKFNPFLMGLFSFVMCFLYKGSRSLSDYHFSKNINSYACEFIIMIVILSIMASDFFINYRLIFRKKNKKEECENE